MANTISYYEVTFLTLYFLFLMPLKQFLMLSLHIFLQCSYIFLQKYNYLTWPIQFLTIKYHKKKNTDINYSTEVAVVFATQEHV